MRWRTPVLGAAIATSCLLPELTKVDSFGDDNGESGGEGVGGDGTTGGAAGTSSSGKGGSSGASGGSTANGGAGVTGGEGGAGDSSGNAGTSGASTGGRGGTSTGGQGGTAAGGKGGNATGGKAGSGNTGGMGNAGGAGAGGSATGGTAGSAGTGTCGNSWEVTPTGYVFAPGSLSTCWQGFAFTRSSSQITPSNFTACGSPCNLCVTGSVGSAIGSASLGFYLNQPPVNPTPSPWTPVSSGVSLMFTNNAGSPLQLVLEGDGGQRWCYDLTGITHPVFVTWSEFNTECVGGTGAPYASQPILSLQLLVPGAATQTPFDFCLDRAAVSN